MNYDIAICGGGPVGLAHACILKALNKHLNVCVIDKRATSTRDFGLAISSDSVAKVISVLDRTLKSQNPNVDIEFAKTLKKHFTEWSRHSSVRTNQIQKELAEKADSVGVKILTGNGYEITENNLPALLNPQAPADLLSPELLALRESLAKTKIIIGADGAHSTVRKTVMGPDDQNRTDVHTYAYALEIKHEIAVNAENNTRKKANPKVNPSEWGHVMFEAIGKANPGTNILPVTDIVIIDEEIHNQFIETNDRDEVVKGNPKAPWSLAELAEKAKTNATIKKYLEKINWQIGRTQNMLKGQAALKPPKVTTIPLEVYRSEQVVKIFQNKLVGLIGDAGSGLVLRRGFNKGLMEAALCAETAVKHLADQPSNASEIPKVFDQYQQTARKIFQEETFWISVKAWFIKMAGYLIKYMLSPIYHFFKKLINSIKNPSQKAPQANA